ncbi:MAG: hypothetical protein HYU37_03740 [Acidobacteria bacterium]|nr:hypothetical protein [Acidobacteriota bacterium]
MLRLTHRQRAVVVEKLPDLANIVVGVLVLGPLVGDNPLSMGLIISGLTVWIALAGFTLLMAGGER